MTEQQAEQLIRYRILGAMLVLGKGFTIPQILRYAELVPTETGKIFAVILSRPDWFEGNITTTEIDGTILTYQISGNGLDSLSVEMTELWDELKNTGVLERLQTKPPDTLSLEVAMDALTELFPQAKNDEEKRHLLEISRIDLAGAESEIAVYTGNYAGPFAEAVQKMREGIQTARALLAHRETELG